jgi:polysaccharide biosynthesis transport protein
MPVVDFAGMWQAVKRRWWVPVSTGALLTVGVAALMLKLPKFYTATALLAVDQQKTNYLPGESFKVEDLKSLEILKSIEREIVSQGVLLKVANRHGLREDAVFAPPKKTGLPYADDEVVLRLGKRVRSSLDKGTRLISIAVDDTNPQRAKEICESILGEATRQSSDETSQTAQLARRTLMEEKARIESKLAANQKAVDDFRARFPTLPLEENQNDLKTNTVEDGLRAASSAEAAAKNEAARIENSVRQIEAAGGKIDALLRLTEIGQREDVASLKRSLGEKQAAFVVIDAEYGPKHPRHRQAVDEINETQAQLSSTIGRAVANMNSRLEKARQDVAALTQELNRRKNENLEFAKVSGEFRTLVSQLKAERANYDRVISRLNDAEVNSATGASILRIVDAPLKPSSPSKPSRLLMTAAGGFFGFSAGLGLVLLLHFMDRTLRSIQAGENLLHLPGLAALPQDEAPDLKGGLLHQRTDAAPQMEAFRSLRTALSILGKGAAARTYLFTSAREGEGTSYTAMNFAVSLAHQGYRTLLIDANLRHPTLDSVFLPQRPATGLADHLTGQGVRDASACQKTDVPSLYLFAAGTTTRHPSEVLNEQAFALLMQDAAKWFHKIVIDTPPVGVVTDALPLARHTDTVCLVVRAASTPRAEVKRAANKLAMAGARPAGFILTHAPSEALSGGFVGDFAAGFTPAPAVRALPAPGTP